MFSELREILLSQLLKLFFFLKRSPCILRAYRLPKNKSVVRFSEGPEVFSGFNQVTLAVRDLDEAFDLYKNILGRRPLAKRKNKSAYLLAGNDWIALVQSRAELPPTTSYSQLALSVSASEFESTSSRIKTAVAPIWQDNSSPGDSLYFLEPRANRLEIHAGHWQSRLRYLRDHPSDEVELYEESQ